MALRVRLESSIWRIVWINIRSTLRHPWSQSGYNEIDVPLQLLTRWCVWNCHELASTQK